MPKGGGWNVKKQREAALAAQNENVELIVEEYDADGEFEPSEDDF